MKYNWRINALNIFPFFQIGELWYPTEFQQPTRFSKLEASEYNSIQKEFSTQNCNSKLKNSKKKKKSVCAVLDTEDKKNTARLPLMQMRPLRIKARIQLALPSLLTLLSWLSFPVSGLLLFSYPPNHGSFAERSASAQKEFFHYIHWYWHLGGTNQS